MTDPTTDPTTEIDEKAAWEQVLAEDTGVDPVKLAEEAADVAAAADPVDPVDVVDPVDKKSGTDAAIEPDPLAEFKAQLQRIEEATAKQLESASKQMRDLNGRFGGLSEQMKQVATEATVAKAAAASPAAQAAIDKAAKTPEKWEAFKKEWEGSGFVESIEEYVASQVRSGTDPTDVAKLVEEQVGKTRQEITQQSAEREAKLQAQIVDLTMTVAHPGWKDTVKSQEFQTWRGSQPADVQALAASDSPEDAIKMLSLYKSTAAATPAAADKAQANRERLQAAVNPTRPEQGARKTLSLDDMTPEQLWAYENRLHAAREKQQAA